MAGVYGINMFIVLEGIDGCGKSTHAKMLARWLQSRGYEVLLTAEPTKGKIGKMIRKVLSGDVSLEPAALALLFAADRVEHVKEIQAALDASKIVVCERYYHSNIAYQGAQGVDRQWLLKINEFAPKPDLVFLLDLDPKAGAQRTDTNEIFENEDFLSRVRSGYLNFRDMRIVYSSRPINEVESELRSAVEAVL
jgi:dTMP kinase